ncbi:MAG TPA: COX15/CtaA family protein [Sphingomonadales bacterium]
MEQAQKLDFPAAAAASRKDRAIAFWLLGVAALVFIMVLVGGATRLTESGLSMVEWEPVTGAIPPLNDAEWAAEFARYQQSPQYQKVNYGMTLAEFKTIYWWEYGHRLLGRLIGLAFFLPLLYFWFTGAVKPELRRHLLALLGLGAFQGLMGWLMVKSGLVDRPSVSHYRLAAHLAIAFIIYGYMVWLAFGLVAPRTGARVRDPLYRWLTIVVALQVIWGAFVAGLRAGLNFNTWPLMEGGLWPESLLELSPAWVNFFENPGAVQFVHRMLAYVVALLAALLWWRLRRHENPSVRAAAHVMMIVVALQLVLGIATLLHAVPIGLGVAHQGGALVVITALLLLAHERRRAP